MGASAGPSALNGDDLKQRVKATSNGFNQNGYVGVRLGGYNTEATRVWADIKNDANSAWFCVFTVFRGTSPYVNTAVSATAGSIPTENDTAMNKFSDADIRRFLNSGTKETRTQWWHISEADGSVWASGSLSNSDTMYNLFLDTSLWSSDAYTFTNGYFKRRDGNEANYPATWITSSNGGCSGYVGGWSNYYEQSCVRSWFAGCEGAPAYNHCCACPTDRANKLIVWAK